MNKPKYCYTFLQQWPSYSMKYVNAFFRAYTCYMLLIEIVLKRFILKYFWIILVLRHCFIFCLVSVCLYKVTIVWKFVLRCHSCYRDIVASAGTSVALLCRIYSWTLPGALSWSPWMFLQCMMNLWSADYALWINALVVIFNTISHPRLKW